MEGDPDWGDLTPESDVGELEMPPPALPEETPEPDSHEEVAESVLPTDRTPVWKRGPKSGLPTW